MPEERRPPARRILVALDASAASLDALAAAASVAARLGGELAGLFVEDEDLLRLAALPFGGIVRSPGGERERLDPEAVEAALRAVAARAREALEVAASRHRLACSFRVARGRVAREVLAASAGVDLVVLGASSHGPRARGALGATARAAAERARTPVLLLGRGTRIEGSVAAVDDGTPAGARAVEVARLLAPAQRPPAVVRAGESGRAALVDALLRLAPALVVLPAFDGPAGAALPERLLAAGIAVWVTR